MVTLMLAVFTVSVGFGVALPLLPYLIERLLGAGVEAAQVSRHTGLLTAVYTLPLFLFPPCGGDYPIDAARGVCCWWDYSASASACWFSRSSSVSLRFTSSAF